MRIINLLPKAKQQALRYEALLNGLWVVASLSLVSFVLVFLAQFGVKFYLQLQGEIIKSQIAQLKIQVNRQENANLKAKVKVVNDLISDYKNLADSSPKWSKVLKAFAPLAPDGLKISTLTVDRQTKAINIAGVSPSRDLVIKLYNNVLQDTADFEKINYPLENIVPSSNINFHFTFYIKDQLLQ